MSVGQCVSSSNRRLVRAPWALKITIGDFFLAHVTFGGEIFAGTTPHSGDAATGPACLGCLRCGFVTVTTQVSPEKSARLGCYFDFAGRAHAGCQSDGLRRRQFSTRSPSCPGLNTGLKAAARLKAVCYCPSISTIFTATVRWLWRWPPKAGLHRSVKKSGWCKFPAEK